MRDKDSVEEKFQFSRVKFDRDREKGKEPLGIKNLSINI